MKITIEATSLAELRTLLGELMSSGGNIPVGIDPIPLTPAAQAIADAPKPAPIPATQTVPGSGLTLEQLKAGMTLKPTASSSLADGTRISVGDYVMHGGEQWAVEATYRGTIIAMNEDGKLDVLKTEDCTAVAGEPAAGAPLQAAAVSVQTAAAQVAEAAQPAASGPVDSALASKLREEATVLVSSEKLTVQQVFEKLGSFGVSQIDGLSAQNAKLFGEWLSAVAAPAPAADKALGF